MKSRLQRVDYIDNLIRTRCISSQQELLRLLREKGYEVTQATLSRDLKDLKTSKVPIEAGGYRYIIPEREEANVKMRASIERSIKGPDVGFHSRIVSVEFSDKMVIVKTRTGYAQSVAADLDRSFSNYFMGTVAGIDTVFVVSRPEATEDQVRKALREVERM